MLAHFYGLQDNPFRATSRAVPPFYSQALLEAVTHFGYSRDSGEGFFLLVAHPGTGKSTAVDAILSSLEPETPVAVLRHTSLEAPELLEEVLRRFGLRFRPRESKPTHVHRLECALRPAPGKSPTTHAVLVIDEAHMLSEAALEELRLLSNLAYAARPLVHISLVAQPELLSKLRLRTMDALRQRISVQYFMGGLSEEETAAYIETRLRAAGCDRAHAIFSKGACVAIFERSNGLPREINILANQAMIVAYLNGSSIVTAQHVASVRNDFTIEGKHRLAGNVAVPASPTLGYEPFVGKPEHAQKVKDTPTIERALEGRQTAGDFESLDEELPFIEAEPSRAHRFIVALLAVATLLTLGALLYTSPGLTALWTDRFWTPPLSSQSLPEPRAPREAGLVAKKASPEEARPTPSPEPEIEDERATSSTPQPSPDEAMAAAPSLRGPTPVTRRRVTRESRRDLPRPVPAAALAASRTDDGVGLAREKRWREAIDAFQEAIAIDPGYSNARFNLGVALLASGRPREAVYTLRTALELVPNDAAVMRALGVSLLQSGDFAGAATALRACIRLQPKDLVAHRQLGYALRELGETESAVEVTEQAATLDSRNPEVQHELGYLLHKSGRLLEARRAFETAIGLDPGLAAPHRSLAAVLLELGDEAAAQRELERARSLAVR